MPTQVRSTGKVGPLPENVAGALAYLTFIPAIIFLARTPYNQNQFVRYHSVQSILVCVATAALAAIVRLLGLGIAMAARMRITGIATIHI